MAKRRGFREMELELFGYLGDLKPGDISHPARAKRLVLACSFRHGVSPMGRRKPPRFLAQILSLFAKHSSSSGLC